ncbi:MAG: caspase family protein [Pseudomonadota bacterium]
MASRKDFTAGPALFVRELYVRAIAGILFALAVSGFSTGAFAAKSEFGSPTKLAFVIGNGDYVAMGDLPNVANDARDIAAKLKELNIDTILAENLDQAGFEKLITDNAEKIIQAEAVIFYYAGHGYQFKGENYLVPANAVFESEEDLTSKAVRLNGVIDLLQDRQRPTLIFLDACRDNPLAGSGGETDYQGGLAQIEAGDSTFVAFATQPGNVTADGIGRNSPFTRALLQHISRPGLSVSDLMIEVRKTVEQATLGRQTPWDQSSLRQQFYFTADLEVDRSLIANNFAAILNDPTLREELKIRLASSDPDALHQFILRHSAAPVGIDRSVDSQSAPDAARSWEPTNQAVGGVEVALAAPNAVQPVSPALENDVASGLSGLLQGDPGSGVADRDVARRVQTELARLGCYRLAIDGIWGRGSRAALRGYYQGKNLPVATEQPSLELLTKLFLDTGRICRQPKRRVVPASSNNSVATTRTRTQRASRATSSRSSKGRTTRKRSGTTRKKPAALPPDISAGVGIGGVF